MHNFKDLLLANNYFWKSLAEFKERDKHLSDLIGLKYSFRPDWFGLISGAGVYVISGGRQLGKTTSLKIYIQDSLERGCFEASQVAYAPCDMLSDRTQLSELIRDFSVSTDHAKPSLLVLDEVTFIKNWELAVKVALDEGSLRNSHVLITGSDRIVLEDSAAAFPGIGRRGLHGKNILLSPLRFNNFVKLLRPDLSLHESSVETQTLIELENLFVQYLRCGGFLSAINFRDQDGIVPQSVLSVYEQWIISDFLRKGKDREKLLDLLRVVSERVGSQVSYSGLAQKTVKIGREGIIEYLDHLERMGVIVILPAFDQNSLSGFPKKDKKIHFRDPLMLHVVAKMLANHGLIAPTFESHENYLAECAAMASFADTTPLYYIKAEGEVDLVVVAHGSWQPYEVKWSERLREEDLKQIVKYPHGLILSKRKDAISFKSIPVKNLPLFLAQLDAKTWRVV
jgi:predicted AAA+ superfamily ATPase